MYYVYVLKSKKFDQIYIGFSSDLRRRIKVHNEGKVYSTRKFIPWKIAYYEAFADKNDATQREKMLKQDGRSRYILKKRIFKSLKGAA